MKKFSTFKFKLKGLNEQEEVEVINKLSSDGSDEQSLTLSGASKFFSKLFESREMAHVYHLSVKGDMGSYAAHVALGDYYNQILEFIDDLIEIYQGQYGLVENFEVIDTSSTKTLEPISYFEDLVEFIKENRNTLLSSKDTHLQNVIDEAIALIYKTLYKLKFNK
jgi:DNA-binding ferritin-like protein